MKKYAQENCPKCGSKSYQHNVKWHLNPTSPEEHLSIRCTFCGYYWEALPMDSENENGNAPVLPSS